MSAAAGKVSAEAGGGRPLTVAAPAACTKMPSLNPTSNVLMGLIKMILNQAMNRETPPAWEQ